MIGWVADAKLERGRASLINAGNLINVEIPINAEHIDDNKFI